MKDSKNIFDNFIKKDRECLELLLREFFATHSLKFLEPTIYRVLQQFNLVMHAEILGSISLAYFFSSLHASLEK